MLREVGRMGWRSRILLGRLRDQAAVVATVALVTFVATTLLGTFAFLLDVTSNDALDAAIARAPDSAVTLEANIRVRNKDSAAAVTAAERALTGVLGDLPAESEAWLHGRLWSLPRADGAPASPLAYAASTPLVPEQADLLSGTWPDRARDDAGLLLVNVPQVAAQRYGWSVGSQVPVRVTGAETTDTWLVVGTHRITGTATAWKRDRLGGTSHDEAFPVPGTMGKILTDLWGPMVVAPEALLGKGLVETAQVYVTPQVGDAPRGAVPATREAIDSAQVLLAKALGEADVSGAVRTTLDETIDAAWRELAVTRIGVIVVGLLLVVLATTVMLLAARMLGERRASESELVAARGASPGQLRSLAVLEAVVLAAVAAAVAPWLARGTFTWLATYAGLDSAGLHTPSGVPASVWIACAAVATVLAVALVVPSWHVSGSSSSSAHVGLVRTGADLALVALAGVTLWQLLDYGAPLTASTSASGVRLDPVLVAGPALVALGAAVLALRLVTPVARVADALADRSRSLVAPLAAWQVARRPAAAAGTTLVVVLAVAAATFSHAFQTTWRTSQLEQVDVAVGTDARVDVRRGEPLTTSADVRAAVADAPAGTRVQPVGQRPVVVGQSLSSERGSALVDTQLLAVDTDHPEALRGRSQQGWPDVVGGLALTSTGKPFEKRPGTSLPGEPQWLVATVTSASVPAAVGSANLRLAVEDDTGLRSWVAVPRLDLGTPQEVVVPLPRALGTVRLVAATASITLLEPPRAATDATGPGERLGHVGLALHDARVVDRAAGVTDEQVALSTAGTPVDLSGATWQGSTTSKGTTRSLVSGTAATVPDPAGLPANALLLDGEFDMTGMTSTNGGLVAYTWEPAGVVQAVITEDLAESAVLGGPVDVFWTRVGDAAVKVQVDGIEPYLPGSPRGPAMIVDHTALGRAIVEAGGTDTLADAWWLTASDADAPALAAAVADAAGGTATVRVTERASAVTGPLRAAVPAALSLVTAATGVLVLVGLGTSATAAVRSRRLELARLQALGAARPSLVAGLVGEHTLLVTLGAGAGLGIGYGLARVVGPVLTVSADGRRPVPAPIPSWDDVAALAITGGLALAACAVVAVLAAVLVRRASGALLRLGDDR